jgi:hypothetical protein
MNELDDAIGALLTEAEFEATVSELSVSGIDRSRISFLAREQIASSCAGAIGCDITQLPRVAIALGDDRQQVRTLATSLATTVAALAGAGTALLATGAPQRRLFSRLWRPEEASVASRLCSVTATRRKCVNGSSSKLRMAASFCSCTQRLRNSWRQQPRSYAAIARKA